MTEFSCKCGFKTIDVIAAKAHLSRCVFCTASKEKEKPVPITILVEALEQMNDIISDALKRYYQAKKE